jgi:hypothetical protein
MHDANPYGHLLVNGQSPTDAQLGVLAGCPSEQIPDLLGELETAGVFSRTRAGVIYSRKMSRMAKKAAIARNNGRKGGNPKLCNNRENPPSDNQQDKGHDKPQKPEARSQKKKDTPNGVSKKGSRLSENWTLPKDWGEWAVSEGVDEVSVRREADRFRDYWIGKAGQAGAKLDWRATWRNWIRKWQDDRSQRRQSSAPTIGAIRTTPDGRRQRYAGGVDGWVVEVQ